MITFIAIFVVICCGLVIFVGVSLSSELEDVGNDVKKIKETVHEIYAQLPYNSWFMSSYRDLNNKLDDIYDHLTTEIACLATKNNEDIKRVKDGYVVGDVLKFDGIEWYVFCKTKLDDGRTRWNLFGQNGAEYRIYTDAMPEDIEFVRHVNVESLFS